MFYIYRITNKINGKTYIGKHKYKKLNDNYMGSGVHLRRAQKKYGIGNFEKKVLVFNISKLEHANLLEKTFIAAEREKVGRENCYNKSDGGDGSAGFHHTEEHKRYMSKKMKGRYVSEETRMRLSKANKGKHHSEEAIRKMSEAHKGSPAWNKGKHHCEETRKLSEALKGHVKSEEHRKHLSEAIKGKHWKLVGGKRVYY